MRYDVTHNEENILNMSGLSIALFKQEGLSVPSGTALRRMFVPFVAKLNHLTQINNLAIENTLNIWNVNRGTMGEETFSYEVSDIEVLWHFQEIFRDELLEEPEPPTEEPEEPPANDG